jgi:hypothetical protein
MSSSMEAPLLQAAAATFESLAFFFTTPELDNGQRAAVPDAAVRLSFDGAIHGTLDLRLCGGLLPELAANMLGEGAAPADGVQLDALGEVANVICGSVLPALSGPDAVFSLGAPHPIDAADVAPAEGERCWSVSIGLDAGRADLSLRVHAP